MTALTLGVISWNIWFLAIAFIIVCLFMMLIILIQKPKGGGLSGAFGGGAGGGSEQAMFGGGVGDVLTIITVVCFVAFLGLAMGLTWAINPSADVETDGEDGTTQTTGIDDSDKDEDE